MYNKILGSWKLDPNDANSQQMYGSTSIEFKNTGELVYTIYLENKEQKIFMSYEIEGNLLITDQPSAPNREKTVFNILSDGKLELCFGGISSRYIKVE